MRRKLSSFALALTLALGSAAQADPALRLERVVIVMRHGVRPPTKSADQLARYSDQAWPGDADWGAAPGELTPHGAQEIQNVGKGLRAAYAQLGLLPAQGDIAARTLIWADGADQRTRESARNVAQGLSPLAPPPFGSGAPGQRDPLFDGAGTGLCPFDPGAAAIAAQAPLDGPGIAAALQRLQAIVAPQGCSGGAGVCLAGASAVVADDKGVKVQGPVGTGATLAEDLLLEYETGLPAAQLGWGRLTAHDLPVIVPLQALSSDITRRTPYVATRRAGLMARFILAALQDQPAPAGAPALSRGQDLILLAGHDTNLSNLAGVFGLDWRFPDQPDPTAPGVALTFERWRDVATGQALLRVRLFYQTPDEVRTLAGTAPHSLVIVPGDCAAGAACEVGGLARKVEARLSDCGAGR